jgi:hypothetical protein
MDRDKVGQARYKGNDKELLQEFGRELHDLYNTEGFYVRDSDGKQVLTNGKWELILDKS